MRKNLLIIVPNLGVGGQERVAINTVTILKDKYNINMVVFCSGGNSFIPCCPLINLDIPPLPGYVNKIKNIYRRIKAIKRIKRELNIDITISFGNTANLVNALSKVSDKIILSIRGYSTLSGSYVSQMIDKVVFSQADIISCVSPKISKDLISKFDISEHKVVTLYNPCNRDGILEQSKEPVQLDIRHPAIVTLGRLEKVKGYRHLLKSFALVQKEIPEATLVFIGEGSQQKELERTAAELGISQQVIFAGFQFNPYSYMAKCDLYVLSSINEGFPNALVEAMVCGLPVIATDCKSGPREILSEYYYDTVATDMEYIDYGILIPPFAADDSHEPALDRLLADAMLHLLKDTTMYKHYQQKSRERARSFTFDMYRTQIIQMIDG